MQQNGSYARCAALLGRLKGVFAAQVVGALLILGCLVPAAAQTTTGTVRGVAKDESGAVLAGAKVTITDPKTNLSQTGQTNAGGEFQFTNLLPAAYQITVEATGFKKITLNDVAVSLNKTTDIEAVLTVGSAGEVVEVSAAGAELVETSTTTLAKSFESRKVVELGQTAVAGGIYNLALVAPNVTGSGGIGVGTGGSVGGQRPRNNNFMVDGVDNNDKSVTGPAMYISPETVTELTLQTNQSASEFGRSTGGQFIVVTKSGTNAFHGTGYLFSQNRNLNALDVQQKIQGFVRERDVAGRPFLPRFDNNRYGGNVGGPIIKDKLFFFTSYEGIGVGQAAAGAAVRTPTAEGFAALSALPTSGANSISAANLAFLRQYLPVASTASGSITVLGRNIPIGPVAIQAPSFTNRRNFVTNIDFNQDEKNVHRFRFIYDRFRAIDTAGVLPVFFTLSPTDNRLTSYTWVHTFSPTINNEFRAAYRRQVNDTPVPNLPAPLGLDTFPNIGLNDLGINIGPNANAPQGRKDSGYQFVDNFSWVKGNHSMKFGADVRKAIGVNFFIQRVRGDYQYAAAGGTELFLRDITPNFLAQRTVGGGVYSGNQVQFFGFAQDDWRVTRNLTVNMGLRYVFQQAPFSADEQAVNAIASVPGRLEFRELKTQKKNFAPVVGLAYAPNFENSILKAIFGESGESSIRAGFSMAYDVIFDNIYLNARTGFPQFSVLIDRTNDGRNGFFAGGAIPSAGGGAPNLTQAQARAGTTSYNPDQQVPYSISYTLGIQRQLGRDFGLELRYLGTRGVNLIVQQQINRQPTISDSRFIPTFTERPSNAQLQALTTTLGQLVTARNGGAAVPQFFRDNGFTGGPMTAQSPIGNSTYHAFSASLNKRFSKGYTLVGAYTFSKLIDDSTAELFSTVLTPRRAQDFQNLRAERSLSALDSTHRFALSGIYELPFFLRSSNWALRSLLGGFSLAGTLTLETGKPFTPLSGVDANLNLDAAGDRSIRNPNGARGTASDVIGLDRNGNVVAPTATATNPIVAYVATNPNAEYIRAQLGARANAGRNTMRLPGINNLDFSVFKNFRIRETMRVQFRADIFNLTNTPQFIPGSLRGVNPVATAGGAIPQVNTIGNANFNAPQRVFSSNPRFIQLALRFDF